MLQSGTLCFLCENYTPFPKTVKQIPRTETVNQIKPLYKVNVLLSTAGFSGKKNYKLSFLINTAFSFLLQRIDL